MEETNESDLSDLFSVPYYKYDNDDILSSLQTDKHHRSSSSIETIAHFLQDNRYLSQYSHFTSFEDLTCLAAVCQLQSLDTSHKEPICMTSDVITHCYIILRGFMRVSTRQTKESFGPGMILGQQLFEGFHRWPCDIHAIPIEPVQLCVIPADAALRYIGKVCPSLHDDLKMFWRYLQVSCVESLNEPASGQKQSLYDSYDHAKSSNETSKQLKSSKISSDIITTARVRIYRPNQTIFHQNDKRYYLYIILKGECALIRSIPYTSKEIQSKSTTIDLDTGIRLLCGDFIYFDGVIDSDTSDAIIGDHEDDRNDPNPSKYDGKHQSTLKSSTFAEICVIPIQLIKGHPVHRAIRCVSKEKYSDLLWTNQKLLTECIKTTQWKALRQKIVRDVLTLRKPNKFSSFGPSKPKIALKNKDIVRSKRRGSRDAACKTTSTALNPNSREDNLFHLRYRDQLVNIETKYRQHQVNPPHAEDVRTSQRPSQSPHRPSHRHGRHLVAGDINKSIRYDAAVSVTTISFDPIGSSLSDQPCLSQLPDINSNDQSDRQDSDSNDLADNRLVPAIEARAPASQPSSRNGYRTAKLYSKLNQEPANDTMPVDS